MDPWSAPPNPSIAEDDINLFSILNLSNKPVEALLFSKFLNTCIFSVSLWLLGGTLNPSIPNRIGVNLFFITSLPSKGFSATLTNFGFGPDFSRPNVSSIFGLI